MAKKKYQKKPFESSGVSSDTSANIYHSMLLSAAWLALTKPQRVLYLTMKDRYYQLKAHPENKQELFYFNKGLWKNEYKLYTNAKQFEKDRDALIEKGLIAVVADGYFSQKKTIYKFSDKWQKYGTNAFKIEFNEMSTSLRHDKIPSDKKRKNKSEKEREQKAMKEEQEQKASSYG